MPVVDTTAAAFTAGLVTSLHCAGMCGPLACAWAVARGGRGTFAVATTLYHTARLLAYGLVGAMAGMAGALPLAGLQHGGGLILPWLLVVIFLLVGTGLDSKLPKPALLAKPLSRFRIKAMGLPPAARAAVVGLLTPLMPCGPLYLMLGLAATEGSAAGGASFAVAFGMGTLPLLLLVQTQLHRLGLRLTPTSLRRLQRGMAFAAALVLAWRLRGSLGLEMAGHDCCGV